MYPRQEEQGSLLASKLVVAGQGFDHVASRDVEEITGGSVPSIAVAGIDLDDRRLVLIVIAALEFEIDESVQSV